MNSCSFSPDRRYRYSLVHRADELLVGPVEEMVLWLMLNPSTADENTLDPTLRRCRAFTLGMGFNVFAVANLFALRSTDPRYMLNHPNPVGPENDAAILDLANRADVIIAAWGAHGSHLRRNEHVLALLKHRKIHCLTLTKDGHPGHPLYLPASAEPTVFREASAA